MSDSKLRLGGMALRNGLLVHGPTHWAAAVRDRNGDDQGRVGPQADVRRRSTIPGVRGVTKLAEAFVVIPLVKRALPAAKLPMQDVRTLGAMAAAGAAGRVAARHRRVALDRRARRRSRVVSLLPAMAALRAGDLASYHGVEHKSIAAYEQDGDAADASKEHDRCGSNLVAPMLASTALGNVAVRRAGLTGPAAEGVVALGVDGARRRGVRLVRAALRDDRRRSCCGARATRSSGCWDARADGGAARGGARCARRDPARRGCGARRRGVSHLADASGSTARDRRSRRRPRTGRPPASRPLPRPARASPRARDRRRAATPGGAPSRPRRHVHAQLVAGDRYGHGHRRRPSVLDHVRQRLLHDAVGDGVDVRRDRSRVDAHVDRQPARPRVVAQRSERREPGDRLGAAHESFDLDDRGRRGGLDRVGRAIGPVRVALERRACRPRPAARSSTASARRRRAGRARSAGARRRRPPASASRVASTRSASSASTAASSLAVEHHPPEQPGEHEVERREQQVAPDADRVHRRYRDAGDQRQRRRRAGC